MATTDESYLQPFIEYRDRDNFRATFRSSLEELATKVDFSGIKSCVAVGTSSGENEIDFAKRLFANLRAFTGVEPDAESADALRASLQEGQLPGVKTAVMTTTVEDWSSTDKPCDIALMFRCLFHVKEADRRALFQKLATKLLNPGGMVVTIEETTEAHGFNALMKRLGKSENRYDDVRDDLIAAGFRQIATQKLTCHSDLSNPSDSLVKFIKGPLLADTVTEDEVREAIADVYSKPEMRVSVKMIAVFQK